MNPWNPTMITGLLGVVYFTLAALVFAPMNLSVAAQIAFVVFSLTALPAVVENFRERDTSTWKTWTGLVGALFILLPGVSLLLGQLVLALNGGGASVLVNTLLSLSSIGMIFLLPIGIILCLLAGFARFHQRRGALR